MVDLKGHAKERQCELELQQLERLVELESRQELVAVLECSRARSCRWPNWLTWHTNIRQERKHHSANFCPIHCAE